LIKAIHFQAQERNHQYPHFLFAKIGLQIKHHFIMATIQIQYVLQTFEC